MPWRGGWWRGKTRNQRTILQRNHLEPPPQSLLSLKQMLEEGEPSTSFEQLLGVEGKAARVYFGDFAGMIKVEEDGDKHSSQFHFDFSGRNRRPPRDAVNAMLSLGYCPIEQPRDSLAFSGDDPTHQVLQVPVVGSDDAAVG